jgi:TP901 family phage tail tape measure protein
MGGVLAKLTVLLGFDPRGFNQGVDGAQARLKRLGAGMAVLGAVMLTALTGATRLAIDFESAMRNVNSIAGLSESALAGVNDQVLALATKSGQAPVTLAEGLYQIVSSGFEAADAMTILAAAATAATAGLTTTDVAAKAITAVLNAYSLGADQAAAVSNSLFQIVNLGVVSFEELAVEIGTVLPTANALGVTLDELGAAYAVLTRAGVSAAESTTQIDAVMRSFIKPTEAMQAAIEAAGFASGEAMIASLGFGGALEWLATVVDGSSEKANELAGDVRAVRGLLGLTANAGEDYAAMLVAMSGAQADGGATAKVLAEQQKSVAFQMQRAKAAIQVVAIRLGSIFLPAVAKGAQAVAKFAGVLSALPKGTQKALAVFATVAAAVLLIGGAILAASGPLTAFVGAFMLLLSPIGLLIAAGAALAYLFRGKIGDALDKVTRSIGYVDDAFRAFRANGVRPVEAALLALGTAFEALTGINVAGWLSSLGTAFDGAVDAVRTFFDLGFDEAIGVLAANIQDAFGSDALTGAVVNGIQLLKNLFTGEWDAAWQDFKDLAVDLGTLTLSGVLALGGKIGEWAGNLWGWIKRELGVGAIAGDASGGPLMDTAPITIGDVLVEAGLKLTGTIERWAGNIWGWVRDQLVTTVGGEGGLAEQRTIRLGTWSIDLPPPETDITGPIVIGWIDDSLEQIIGVEVELQHWKMNLANPGNDLTLLDVVDWVDMALESIVGVEVELQSWKLGLANPENDLTVVDVVNWIDQALENLLMVDVELQDWKLNFVGPNSDTSLADVVGWIDDILEQIVGIDVELQNWKITLGMPDIELGFSVADFWNAVKDEITSGGSMEETWADEDSVLGKSGSDRRGMALADPVPAPDFSAFTAAWQAAGALVTHATLAIESRVTAMAGVLTAMAFNAGDGFRAGVDRGFQAAAALATNVTLGLEARLAGFAGVATATGFNAGDGWDAGVSRGMQAGGATITTTTLAMESRLAAFAGAATVAGFNAGDGFFAGVDQGVRRAVGAAQAGAGQIIGALSFNLYPLGYNTGANYSLGFAQGINAYAAQAAANAYNMVAMATRAADLAGLFSSPSKVMARRGRWFGEGFADGIRATAADVVAAAGGLVDLAVGAGSMPAAPRLAPMGALSGMGGRAEQRPVVNNYYISDNVIGDDAEAWIARVSVRSAVPAIGKAIDQERRAQGMR